MIHSLSIFNPSGGTAQSGRRHCSISAERLINSAGRGDLMERCTHRTAIAILEKVEPQNWPALAMERNLLMMEHRLGFIKNYEEIERERERNNA